MHFMLRPCSFPASHRMRRRTYCKKLFYILYFYWNKFACVLRAQSTKVCEKDNGGVRVCFANRQTAWLFLQTFKKYSHSVCSIVDNTRGMITVT